MIPALLGALGGLSGPAGAAAGAGASGLATAMPVFSSVTNTTGKLLDGLTSKLVPFNKDFLATTTNFTKMQSVIAPAKEALGAVGAVIGKVTEPVALFTKGIQTITAPVLQAVGAISELQNAVNAVGNSVAGFVAKANPAIVQHWQYAVDDWTASIGHALTPVLIAATTVTRAFADVTFALAGPVQRLGKAFDPLVAAIPRITTALTPAIRDIGRFIDKLAEIIRPLAELGAEQLGDVIGVLAGQFQVLTSALSSQLAIMGPLIKANIAFVSLLAANPMLKLAGRGGGSGGDMTGGSKDAAVRGVSIGSVEAFQNKAFTAAFSLGGGPAAETADNTKSILELLREKLNALGTLPKDIADALRNVLRDALPGGGASREDVKVAIGDKGRAAGRYLEGRLRSSGVPDSLNPFGG